MAPLEVVIIGGGLAGACLANGLLNHSNNSIEVTIFERDIESSERGGYQIRLGSHALIGFRACLTERQYQDLLPCFGRSGGVVSSAPAIFNSNMDLVLDLSKFPIYEKSAPIGRAILRDFLQKPLRERKAIQYGKKYVRFEVLDIDEGRIRAHFDDGSYKDCDILISAEGSGSRINKEVGLDNIITKVTPGTGSLLGKCHLPLSVLRTLPQKFIEKGSLYTVTGKAAMFAAAYLPSKAVDASKMVSPDQKSPTDYNEQEASLFVAASWTGGPSGNEIAQIPDKKRFLKDKLMEAGFHPDFTKMIDALDPEALQTVPLRYARDTPIEWRDQLRHNDKSEVDLKLANSRIWLVGDSIHSMLPSRGMGANNAIHDTADALAPLLELARQKKARGFVTDEDMRTQLAHYEKAMIPRAFSWVKKSSQQQLPDLESVKGKIIMLGLRLLLYAIGSVMGIVKFLGWKPRDDAPELP